jgi:hypothetical protein
VGVEARKDLRDCVEVAVDELAQTTVVVDSARARAPSDEELEVRDAECVLDVDGEETEAKGVLCRWAYTVLIGPRLRLARAVLVWNPPNFAYAARLEVLRELQLTHCAIQSLDVHNYVPLGSPVQPSRGLDIDLSWQTSEHLLYCPGPTG